MIGNQKQLTFGGRYIIMASFVTLGNFCDITDQVQSVSQLSSKNWSPFEKRYAPFPSKDVNAWDVGQFVPYPLGRLATKIE